MPPPYPLRHVTARVTAGTGESHAGDSCCSAGPPRPPSPRGLSLSRWSLLRPPAGWAWVGGSSPGPWECGGLRGAVPVQGPGAQGTRGSARDSGPRAGMCGRTPCPRQPINSRWRGPRGSQQVALPDRSLLLRVSSSALAVSLRYGCGELHRTPHSKVTEAPGSPHITPRSCPRVE